MIHRIDKYILKELLTHDSLPFSELRPPGVESNTLTYRLKRFLNEGIVGKTEHGYYLTAAGQRFTDNLNLGKFVPRDLPKPLILMMCTQGDEWLLYKRAIHPLKDLSGFPHANVKPGISVLESAQTRLNEVIGLKTRFAYRGSGFLAFYKGENLEGYNHFTVVKNVTPITGILNPEPEEGMGRYYWQKDPDFTSSDYIASLKDITKLAMENSGPFFAELTYHL